MLVLSDKGVTFWVVFCFFFKQRTISTYRFFNALKKKKKQVENITA